ncbi:hypothetical protein L7F22_050429 [Adiantum nelumboides]|nr:hypothetical protein [Adiantum nelumboides]
MAAGSTSRSGSRPTRESGRGDQLGGENQEWSTQDLYEAIDNGKPPSWTIQFSTKTEAEAAAYRNRAEPLFTLEHDPWLGAFGRPRAAESPLFVQRRWPLPSGRQCGPNSRQLPLVDVANFDRDGHSTVLGNQGDRPMYPASWDPYRYEKQVVFPKVNLKPGAKVEHFSSKIKDIDYEQPRYFFEQVLSDHDKANFMDNWAGALSMVKRGYIVEQLLKQFRIVNPQLAEGVSQRLAQLKAKATSP